MFLPPFFKKSFWQNNVANCNKAVDVFTCRQKYVVAVLNKYGVADAFVLIENLKKADPGFGPVCHSFAHTIGVSAYILLLNGADVFSLPISACEVGYIHGLMMEIVIHKEDLKFARDYCEKLRMYPNVDGMYIEQCYHGIGHGLPLYLAYRHNFKTITKAKSFTLIDDSMKLCDENFGGEWECKRGLFGGIASIFIGDHGLTMENVKINDVFSVCKPQPDDLRSSCYEMLTPALLFFVHDDVNQAIYYMNLNIKSDTDKEIMANRIGQAITTYNDKITSQEVKHICDQVSGNSHFECILGYMNGYIDSKFGNVKDQVLQFCNSGVFTDKEAAVCRKGGMI